MTDIDIEGLKAKAEPTAAEVCARSMRDTLRRWDAAKGRGGYPTAMERYAMAKVLEERSSLIAQRAELLAENARLREALTPSMHTKAAYIGEFKTSGITDLDEDGDPVWGQVVIEWTATKEIMAAILARATQSTVSQDAGEKSRD